MKRAKLWTDRVPLAVTQPAGVWDYMKDGGSDYTRWSLLMLDAEPYSGEVIVEMRGADRVTDLPAWPFRRLNQINQLAATALPPPDIRWLWNWMRSCRRTF
ncbi:MAG TPA: hypothetical protein VI136_10205 [Verrucomicrobiae bacterium]